MKTYVVADALPMSTRNTYVCFPREIRKPYLYGLLAPLFWSYEYVFDVKKGVFPGAM